MPEPAQLPPGRVPNGGPDGSNDAPGRVGGGGGQQPAAAVEAVDQTHDLAMVSAELAAMDAEEECNDTI